MKSRSLASLLPHYTPSSPPDLLLTPSPRSIQSKSLKRPPLGLKLPPVKPHLRSTLFSEKPRANVLRWQMLHGSESERLNSVQIGTPGKRNLVLPKMKISVYR